MESIKEMTDAFHQITELAGGIGENFGSPVKNDIEYDDRLENAKNLTELVELARDFLTKINEICVSENRQMKIFSDKIILKHGGVPKWQLQPEQHVDLTIEETSENSTVVEIAPERASPEVPPTPAETWTKVVRNPRVARPAIAQSTAQRPTLHEVKVSDDTVLNCVPVRNMAGCAQFPGYICWAEAEKTFCFVLNEMFINLGPGLPKIFDNSQQPRKVRVHKYLKIEKGKIDPETTDFFVPARYSNRADQANMINGLRYEPRSYGDNDQNMYAIRIGDRDNFQNDVKALHPEHLDFIYFQNVASGHFLTMLAALSEFQKQSK